MSVVARAGVWAPVKNKGGRPSSWHVGKTPLTLGQSPEPYDKDGLFGEERNCRWLPFRCRKLCAASDSCFLGTVAFFPFAIGNNIERPTALEIARCALNLPEITDLRSPTDLTEVESRCQTLESKCHVPDPGVAVKRTFY